MVFQRSNTAVYSYLGKRFEMAMGLGLILFVMVLENILTNAVAIILFVAVVISRLPSTIKGFAEFSFTEVTVDEETITVSTKEGDKQYQLDDFKIMLFKRRGKKVTVFVLMSEHEGVKFEYFEKMNDLFEILIKRVMLQKEVPWWQRL